MNLNGPEYPTRLDRFLCDALDADRNGIQAAIKNGDILVNDTLKKASYLLKESDTITVKNQPDTKKDTPFTPQNGPLDLLYEDKTVLIVNKPINMITHPNAHHATDTLANFLAGYTQTLSTLSGENRPGIVHRLDQNTEGLLIIAKNNPTHEALKTQFKEKHIQKHYFALIKGDPINDTFTITAPLGRNSRGKAKMKVTHPNDPLLKTAITHVTVLKRFGSMSLVSVQTETGRTHQIRVHLAHLDHPIIGDAVYGKASKNHTEGPLLQAYHLSFIHPEKEKRLTFILPMSPRLKAAIKADK